MAKRNRNRKFNSKPKNRSAPVKYAKNSVERKSMQQKVKFEDDAPDVKENIPIYTDENDECLLETLKEFENVTSTYELWETEADTIVYARFRRCLKGSARDSWDSIIEGQLKSQENFEEQILALSEEVLGLDAEENQKEYLKNTPKPNNMSVKIWLRRIKHINGLVRLMGEGATGLTTKIIIKEVITENVPAAWRVHLKAQRLHRSNSIAEVQQLLEVLEEEHIASDDEEERESKNNQQSGKGKGKNQKSGSTAGNSDIKNPCKIPNHKGHDWRECYNNPNSKNFKGTAKSLKDYNKDGSRKKNDSEEGRRTEHTSDSTKGVSVSWADSDSDEESRMTVSDDGKETLSSELLVLIPTSPDGSTQKLCLALFDTGASSSLINENLLEGYTDCDINRNDQVKTWKTQVGSFETSKSVDIKGLRLIMST